MLTMEKPLSNVQQELLKIYSSDIKEEELSDLKQVLAIFFAHRSSKNADNIWQKQKLNNQTMDEWLNE